jgi:hypothetical protein
VREKRADVESNAIAASRRRKREAASHMSETNEGHVTDGGRKIRWLVV